MANEKEKIVIPSTQLSPRGSSNHPLSLELSPSSSQLRLYLSPQKDPPASSRARLRHKNVSQDLMESDESQSRSNDGDLFATKPSLYAVPGIEQIVLIPNSPPPNRGTGLLSLGDKTSVIDSGRGVKPPEGYTDLKAIFDSLIDYEDSEDISLSPKEIPDTQIKKYEQPVVESVKESPVAPAQSPIGPKEPKDELRKSDEKKRKDREGKADEKPNVKKRKVDALLNDAPTPETDEKIFSGIEFVLTGLRKSPTLHDDIEGIIQKFGGTLIESPRPYEEVRMIRTRETDIPSVILISHRELRTYKYLLALAQSTLTLQFNWVIHSAEQKKLLPYRPYMLPSGRSSIDHRLYTHYNTKPSVFSGWSLHFVAPEALQTQWNEVARASGALILDRPPVSETQKWTTPHAAVITLGDNSPNNSESLHNSPELLKKSRVPVVLIDWFIECLIRQSVVDHHNTVFMPSFDL